MDNAGRHNIYALNLRLLLLTSDNDSGEVANKSVLCDMEHWSCDYIYCVSLDFISFDQDV